jgi:SAM-dependent methyltransferase
MSNAVQDAWDPRQLQVHRSQPTRDVPYVPTDEKVVRAILDFANVGPNDVLYDLGCGDGRIVIEAARRGARAVGVDIDLQRIHESRENAHRWQFRDRISFIRGSFFDIDLRTATVVTLYLLPGINLRLRPKLLFELMPGSRVISNNFDMKEWTPDATEVVYNRNLYKWLIPAWVAGDWKLTLNHPKGRRHASMRLTRRLKHFAGTARYQQHEVHITEGRLIGRSIRFTLWHPQHLCPAIHFNGEVTGNTMRGLCHTDAGSTFAWCATNCSVQ